MARPQKIGLDYFPLDVYVDQDDKIVLVEAQHGVVGFGVIIKILMKIYSEGYFYNWNEKEQILFSKRVNVDINTLNNIINDCIKWGVFDSKLFNKYKILTSNGIQIRYFEAASRRQTVEVTKEYLLVKNGALESFTNLVIVNINKDNDNINTAEVVVNDNISTQRKEEKRIEENSKEENLSLQIKNLRTRFSDAEIKIIDEYFDILRWTRKHGKIADSVLIKIYTEWEEFPTLKVIHALKVYTQNAKYHDKRENYCYGIMRNVTAEEIEARQEIPKPDTKNNNPQKSNYQGSVY